MENFEKLKTLVASIEEDVVKFDGGNATAGTRVRKGMQEIKVLAQTVRTEITEIKHKG